jgi:hypothetical protein
MRNSSKRQQQYLRHCGYEWLLVHGSDDKEVYDNQHDDNERKDNDSLAGARFFVLRLPLTRNNWLYSYGALHFVQFIVWMWRTCGCCIVASSQPLFFSLEMIVTKEW